MRGEVYKQLSWVLLVVKYSCRGLLFNWAHYKGGLPLNDSTFSAVHSNVCRGPKGPPLLFYCVCWRVFWLPTASSLKLLLIPKVLWDSNLTVLLQINMAILRNNIGRRRLPPYFGTFSLASVSSPSWAVICLSGGAIKVGVWERGSGWKWRLPGISCLVSTY